MSTKRSIDVIPGSPRAMRDDDHQLEPGIEDDHDDDEAGDEFELIDLVRHRLGLGDDPSDVTIAASLAAIAAKADNRGRWLAAFGSPLGRWLASRGADLNTALNVLVSLSPRAMN